jgi:hypothetical protein
MTAESARTFDGNHHHREARPFHTFRAGYDQSNSNR